MGQTSLGGLAVSTDGSTLYVMNLVDRKLYVIPTANPASAQAVSLPAPADATGPVGVPGGDLRPFAVTYYNNMVYVGMVNSAESTQNRATCTPTSTATTPKQAHSPRSSKSPT